MSKTARLLLTVSRPEFLPANSASLIIGLSWGLTFPVDIIWGLVIPLILSFSVITLVASFAAHVNTMSDYELDLKDETKGKLVQAMSQLGRKKIKLLMILELSLSLALLLSLVIIQAKPVLLFMWIIAVFLAYAYSAPPLRFKSRSFLAVITLMIVLSILPVTFVTYVFTTTLDYPFWVFLSGQALTVYAVIIPAEIRDYFGDKAKGVVTMTVQLGLVNASGLGITILGVGGILCGTGFILKLIQNQFAILSAFLVIMAITYLYVLRAYWKLYKLSKKLTSAEEQNKTEQAIVELAARNPRWITLITQIIVIMCIVLLASKLIA